jgi:hypothetical protein
MDGSGNCKLPSASPRTGLTGIQHFKMKNVENYNLETFADVFIWRYLSHIQCNALEPFYEIRRMVPK